MRPVIAIALGVCLLFGCAQKPSIPTSHNEAVVLPAELGKSPLALDEILNYKEKLNPTQLRAVLRRYLDQSDNESDQQNEAAYMLGRATQSCTDKEQLKESLACFQIAKDLPVLHDLSLWHISQVAASLGQEKVVRQSLEEILQVAADHNISQERKIAAEYGLAQSYLRASETERAYDAFKTIHNKYPKSEYGIGALYYLGEIALRKTGTADGAGSSATLKFDPQLLKESLADFGNYLNLSPSGSFSTVIIDRQTNLKSFDYRRLSRWQQDALAKAMSANNKWQAALSIWNNQSNKRLFDIAICYLKLGKIDNAKAALVQAINEHPSDYRYAAIASAICTKLTRDDSLKFWKQILSCKPKNADAAYWNVAIRSTPPTSTSLFRELLTKFPGSSYAPESQWWVFWYACEHDKGKSTASLISSADACAKKYSKAKAAPRFLYWAAKLSEKSSQLAQAQKYYEQTANGFPADYYGYRAWQRLNALKKQDDTLTRLTRLVCYSNPNWAWPTPSALGATSDTKNNQAWRELAKLKQYDESLELAPANDVALRAWLTAQQSQPLQAINLATSHIFGRPRATDLWQYAFPLLYGNEIASDCQNVRNVDPCLVQALTREESRYNPLAVSSSKAFGLTQLLPDTAYGVAHRLNMRLDGPMELFEPSVNLKLGINYLSETLQTFNNNPWLALASYNGGAGSVKLWLRQQARHNNDLDYFVENIPFRETRDYVRKVMRSYFTYLLLYRH